MSVRIFAVDKCNRPLVNAKVFVKWKGNHSQEYTDSSGIADLKCSGGTFEFIEVNNYKVMGSGAVGDYDTLTVILNK